MAAVSLVLGSVFGFALGIASMVFFGVGLIGAIAIWSVVGGMTGILLVARLTQEKPAQTALTPVEA